jgi:hypothetical protein
MRRYIIGVVQSRKVDERRCAPSSSPRLRVFVRNQHLIPARL